MVAGFPDGATLHQRGRLVVESPPLVGLLALHVRHCAVPRVTCHCLGYGKERSLEESRP